MLRGFIKSIQSVVCMWYLGCVMFFRGLVYSLYITDDFLYLRIDCYFVLSHLYCTFGGRCKYFNVLGFLNPTLNTVIFFH